MRGKSSSWPWTIWNARRSISAVLTKAKPTLRLLILHDDDEREFDYTSGAEQALEQAGKDGWTVVSVKNDWATVF